MIYYIYSYYVEFLCNKVVYFHLPECSSQCDMLQVGPLVISNGSIFFSFSDDIQCEAESEK